MLVILSDHRITNEKLKFYNIAKFYLPRDRYIGWRRSPLEIVFHTYAMQCIIELYYKSITDALHSRTDTYTCPPFYLWLFQICNYKVLKFIIIRYTYYNLIKFYTVTIILLLLYCSIRGLLFVLLRGYFVWWI